MSVSSQQEITQLLVAWNSGDRFCCAKLSEELRMRYVSFFMAEKAYYVAAFATIHAVSRNKEIPKNKILSG